MDDDISPEELEVAEILVTWDAVERARNTVKNEYVYPAKYSRPRDTIFSRNGGILPGEGVEHLMGERSLPFEKVLTSSDVDGNQARLIIMKDMVVKHLLPLLRENEDLWNGIPVKTYNAAGVGIPMIFKIWGNKSHVLMSGWKIFVKENSLNEPRNHRVTIQAFRHATTQKLGFLVFPSVHRS